MNFVHLKCVQQLLGNQNNGKCVDTQNMMVAIESITV